MSDTAGKGKRKTVFLDRDGTVIEEVDYLSSLDDMKLIPGAAEALHMLREAGFAIILVTNQSGVARGYFSDEFVRTSHSYLEDLLGIKFDGIYYCPHHPDAGCACRKPAPGMILDAVRDLSLDLSGSYMVGDKPADIELATRVEIPGILVRTGYGNEFFNGREGQAGSGPAHVARDLPEACRFILRDSQNRRESGG